MPYIIKDILVLVLILGLFFIILQIVPSKHIEYPKQENKSYSQVMQEIQEENNEEARQNYIEEQLF